MQKLKYLYFLKWLEKGPGFLNQENSEKKKFAGRFGIYTINTKKKENMDESTKKIPSGMKTEEEIHEQAVYLVFRRALEDKSCQTLVDCHDFNSFFNHISARDPNQKDWEHVEFCGDITDYRIFLLEIFYGWVYSDHDFFEILGAHIKDMEKRIEK